MAYLIKPNTVIAINETSGTIQNVDQASIIELSDNSNFTSSIALHPYQMVNFSNQLYARLYGDTAPFAEIRVVPFKIE